jgi:putative membrane protein
MKPRWRNRAATQAFSPCHNKDPSMKPLSLSLAALAISFAATQAMAQMSPGDKAFATKAATGSQAEIALGRLAAQNAEATKVREFGQHMVADHTQASQLLEAIAHQQQMTLPAKPASADQATEERLRAMKGGAFDAAYMKDMVQDHRQDVADFRKEAESGTDPALKAFAQQQLPVLEQHLKMAESVAAK